MRKQAINNIFLLIAITFAFASCKKYLDAKSDKHLSTPDTIEDLQAMLDNEYIYRYGIIEGQTLSDEYYVPFVNWQSRNDLEKLGYVWDPNIDDNYDWTQQYSLILIANTVLDRMGEIDLKGPEAAKNEIRGSALFLRSYCFYHLAQLYALQYDSATSNMDPGIVLRLDPDFNVPSQRSTVQQTYDQIIKDLEEAVTLLPTASISKTRPGKAAGYAMLARVYLQIGNYAKAKAAATQSLAIYGDLIDYNDPTEVNPTSNSIPIIKRGTQNKEIVYYQNDEGSLTISSTARIDSVLYKSYETNDIRRQAFFRKNPTEDSYRFKGSYSGNAGWFVGLGTAEQYLIKAECNVRTGNIPTAMQDLKDLLIKRYKTGTVPTFNPANYEEALMLVLRERKKEMVYRGVRWSDLKRLNKNALTATTITRNLNGSIYTLAPNDKRYALLIPSNVMQLIKLPQNPR